MKHPSIDELHNSGRYVLLDSFRIDEMNLFILRELGIKTKEQAGKQPFNWKRLLISMVIGLLVGALLGFVAVGSDIDVASTLLQTGASFLSFLILIPLHEVIHAGAFRQVGAPKVHFGASLKSLIVYAYTQNYVHTMRELAYVAVMPFLVITSGLIAGWIVWPQYGVFWGMTLLMHTMACIGDFVMIRYHVKNRHRTIYTYDDIEGEYRSYFFAEKEAVTQSDRSV